MSSDHVFTFVVDSSTSESLRVSWQNLKLREDEMLQTALKLGVGDKWKSSLLYGEYQKAPLVTNHTLDCQGKSWLTAFTLQWITNYYETGMLHIPKDAHGYSVLAALEYFCVLYSPDQCHFADYNVYERVQMWARYLSYREALTESVRTTEATTFYGVTPSACEQMDLGTIEIAPLGGAKLANVAHRLFQRQDQEATVKELRDDFCHHVSSTIGPAKFTVKPVTIYAPTKVVNRAVLTVHRADKPTSGSEERRRKLVFMLPDELDKSNIVVKTDDNTVTSGLTGPFYTDTTGHVKDIFEHEEAKRHEWVQTALMNRGITERMEKLLNPIEEERRRPEIWEWLTGLGVCEMSRNVVESVESYMKEKKPPAPIVPLNARPPSLLVKDRIKQRTAALTDKELAEKELLEKELLEKELLDKKDCDSKDSPRGVADFYCYQEPPKRIQPVVEVAREEPPECEALPPTPKKKGIMGLFRRRKEEA